MIIPSYLHCTACHPPGPTGLCRVCLRRISSYQVRPRSAARGRQVGLRARSHRMVGPAPSLRKPTHSLRRVEWVVVLLAMTIAGSLCLSEEIAARAPRYHRGTRIRYSEGGPGSTMARAETIRVDFGMPVWCYLLARGSEGSACGIFIDRGSGGLSCATLVFQVAMRIRTV